MEEKSNNIAKWALGVSIASFIVTGTISGLAYYSTYQRDQREISLKRPTLDVRVIEKAPRNWVLAIIISNKSDQRVKVTGFAIPAPKGGYIQITQTAPDGKFASGADLNSETKQTTDGRPFDPGQDALYLGKYEIADAFAAPPDVALTLDVKIRYLGSKERDETLSVTRALN